jgi:membrane protease YdiL (CAAX protease family)
MTEEKTRFHETTFGVFVVSFALMVIAGVESGVVPWAPFYVIYAALATWIPLYFKTYRFGPIKKMPWWGWVIFGVTCVVVAIVMQAFVGLLLNGLYARIVVAMGGVERLEDPLIDVDAMFNAMFAVAGERLGVAGDTVATWYLAFIALWAGLGEELYFRGYVQGTLRKRHSARYAIVVAAALFGARHYMQMVLLLPKYPIFAASAWVVMAFALGIFLGFLYERTRSLWLPVIIHYLFNLIAVIGRRVS